MKNEHKKMVTWFDLKNQPTRLPPENTIVLMIVDYEVCIGYYDMKYGFQKTPVQCELSNHFNSKNVTPTFWAYLPEHPFTT